MAPRPQVSIRLATDGKAQVERDFADIGTSGEAQAKRYQAAWERAGAEAEAAVGRQAKAAERLAAVSTSPLQQQINRNVGIGDSGGNARASAQALAQQLNQAEQEAKQLIAAIDPLFAAQARYEAQVERINAVKVTGQIDEQRYQQLLAHEKTLLDQSTAAAARNVGVRGSMRMGMQQLSFQIGDVSQQMALGVRASTIFAQQSGQVIQALQIMGGEGNAFLRFLGGPWGIALSAAAVALTPMIGKLLESGENVDDLVEKLKKEATTAGLNDEAHRVFAGTLDGVTEALKKNRDALKGLTDQGKTAAEQALAAAKGQLVMAEVNKFAAESEIRYARAILERQRAQVIGPETKGHLDPAQAELNRLINQETAQLDALDDPAGWQAAIDNAKRQIADAESHIAVEAGLRDAAERIKRMYDGPEGLIERTRQRLVNEHATQAVIEAQTRALAKQRDAEVEAANARDKKPAKNAGGTAIFNDQIDRFFDIAAKYRGMSESKDRLTLKSFLGDVDPEKTKWCAAFVNAVLAAGGVDGTGSLAAKSFLNYGKDDTSSPQRGDIVVLRTSAGEHVGFLDSIAANGSVSVLGGNTSNKVGTATYSASSVLGVRRPPTPAEAFADEAKAEQERVKTLQDLMDKEAEVTVTKEHQVNYIQQYNSEADRTLETTLATVASLKDWDRQVELLTASMDEFRQFGADILDTVFNPDNWKSWGDLGKQVLHEIQNELIKMALLNPLKNLLTGSTLPTFGGLLTMLGGGVGGGASPAGASVPAPSPTFGNASGTEYFSGGMTWVGEFGKELVNLPRGSRITSAAESRRLAAANDGGIGPLTFNMPVDARGADEAAIARLDLALQQHRAELPGVIIGTIQDARQRNVLRF